MKIGRLIVNVVVAGLLVSNTVIAATNTINSGLFSVVDGVSASQFADPLFHQPNDPVGGNQNGKITIVEFFDYQCPHCIDMSDVLDKLLAQHSNLRIVFKELPFRGPVSEFAARAALAAKKQGNYVAFHNALMHSKQQSLTNVIVLELAGAVGLDLKQLTKDMDDPSIDQQIKGTSKLAQDLRVSGTPAFFIGKTAQSNQILSIMGAVDQARFEDALNKAFSE
jgi:protein-disulfide isomerase